MPRTEELKLFHQHAGWYAPKRKAISFTCHCISPTHKTIFLPLFPLTPKNQSHALVTPLKTEFFYFNFSSIKLRNLTLFFTIKWATSQEKVLFAYNMKSNAQIKSLILLTHSIIPLLLVFLTREVNTLFQACLNRQVGSFQITLLRSNMHRKTN